MNGFVMPGLFLLATSAYALLTDTLIMEGIYKKEDSSRLFCFGTVFYAVTGIISFTLYLRIP